MPKPGEQAPGFTLPSTEGDLRLSDLLQGGPVLLAFYFEDATPTCSTEIESLKDAHETLRELGASIVAISADSIESHRKFAERLGGLPFPLASDADLHAASPRTTRAALAAPSSSSGRTASSRTPPIRSAPTASRSWKARFERWGWSCRLCWVWNRCRGPRLRRAGPPATGRKTPMPDQGERRVSGSEDPDLY